MNTNKKPFVAWTIYHHRERTSEQVMLTVYRDLDSATFELYDARDAVTDENNYFAGGEDFILAEWREANQKLIEDGFVRDNMRGESKWQRLFDLPPNLPRF